MEVFCFVVQLGSIRRTTATRSLVCCSTICGSSVEQMLVRIVTKSSALVASVPHVARRVTQWAASEAAQECERWKWRDSDDGYRIQQYDTHV